MMFNKYISSYTEAPHCFACSNILHAHILNFQKFYNLPKEGSKLFFNFYNYVFLFKKSENVAMDFDFINISYHGIYINLGNFNT